MDAGNEAAGHCGGTWPVATPCSKDTLDAIAATLSQAAVRDGIARVCNDNIPELITQECRSLEALLHDKNRKYGNSALAPQRIFSKMGPLEQLKVRIDDKLSRISNGNEDLDEDTVQDLAGYLILYLIGKRLKL